MLVLKLLQFLLLLGLSSAADFQTGKEVTLDTSNTSSIKIRANEWLMGQKQMVLDFFLQRFNQLIKPTRLAFLPWGYFACSGWPENVPHYTKDWTLEDVQTLEANLLNIDFSLNALPQNFLSLVPKMMLSGEYSNTTFDLFSQKYRLISFMGQGGFGFVLKCLRISDSTQVAVKFIYQPRLEWKQWGNHPTFGRVPIEVDILSKVSHPGIIKLLDYFDDGAYSYMVTELFGTSWTLTNRSLTQATHPTINFNSTDRRFYAEEGYYDLEGCLRLHTHLPDDKIHYIFSQVYRAILDLHRNGICHGDLKIENILIDAEYRIKIIDFGISREINEEAVCGNFSGTKLTMPPEVLLGMPHRDVEAETWTLGVLLYILKFNAFPFYYTRDTMYKELNLPAQDPTGKEKL